jgi:hypothetical protein
MIGADWGNFYSKLNSMTQVKEGRRTTQVRAQQRQQHVAAQKSDTNVGKLVEARWTSFARRTEKTGSGTVSGAGDPSLRREVR